MPTFDPKPVMTLAALTAVVFPSCDRQSSAPPIVEDGRFQIDVEQMRSQVLTQIEGLNTMEQGYLLAHFDVAIEHLDEYFVNVERNITFFDDPELLLGISWLRDTQYTLAEFAVTGPPAPLDIPRPSSTYNGTQYEFINYQILNQYASVTSNALTSQFQAGGFYVFISTWQPASASVALEVEFGIRTSLGQQLDDYAMTLREDED